jgi:hypothetical protein
MLLRQSESAAARRTRMFVLRQTDGVTPFTSAISGADVQLCKAGAALGNAVGAATNLSSSGLYKLVLDATDVDTLGELVLQVVKTGVQSLVLSLGQVVPWDPYDAVRAGLTALRPDAQLIGHAVTGTLTAGSFSTDLVLASGSLANEAHCRFITGALTGQIQKITGYTGGVLSFTQPFTSAPANLDTFVVVND